MAPALRIILLPFLVALVAACGSDSGDMPVTVAFIGSPDAVDENDLRLSVTGQHLRAATAEGLVTLDDTGAIIPAIAERWLVTDDGQSYIFRLRDTQWADGAPITSQSVRSKLTVKITQLDGTSLGRDLDVVDDVIARAGRVVEFRLKSPMPDFLQLLAQPELGLRSGDGGNRVGTGPMTIERKAGGLLLTARAPELRGLPQTEDWGDDYRPITLRIADARAALDMFDEGTVNLVLNGHISHLPLADTGPLSRGTVRLDGTYGLFGFRVRSTDGVVSTAPLREALAMAIDRSDIMEPFNLGGWTPTTRVVAPGLTGDTGAVPERWQNLSIEQRVGIAGERVTAWSTASGQAATIRVSMPDGPGAQMLFDQLRADWQAIGITATLAKPGETAQLVMIDRVARFGHARWFLNQFACPLRTAPLRDGLCSADADALVVRALTTIDSAEREALLAQAETVLTQENVYIPLGAPIRWSLVRGNITGFAENPWAIHPLFPLARRPI